MSGPTLFGCSRFFLLHTDPLLTIFHTFSELNGLTVSAALSIMPSDALATSVGKHVRAASTLLILVHWLLSMSMSTSMATQDAVDTNAAAAATSSPDNHGPFDTHSRVGCSTFLIAPTLCVVCMHMPGMGMNVVLLVGVTHNVREEMHLFLVFSSGPDDGLCSILLCSSV